MSFENLLKVSGLAGKLDCHSGAALTGGYAESYVPFCGLAVMEVMSGQRTELEDKFAQAWINPRFNQFHRGLIDEMASA